MSDSEEDDGQSTKDDLSSFLAKVDEIGDLVKGLAVSDPDESSEAIRQADEYLERIQTRSKSKGVVKGDRTIINKDVKASPGTQSPNSEAAAFCRAMEEDARERGERRREHERVGRERKKRGNKAFRRDDYNSAVELYSEAIKEMPWDIALYTNRALAYNRLGRHQEAIKDCDLAIKFEPNTLKAYVHKGSALVSLGRYREAEKWYNEACQLFPAEKGAMEGYIQEMKTSANS